MRLSAGIGAVLASTILISLYVLEPKVALLLAPPPAQSPASAWVHLRREAETWNLSGFKAWGAEEEVSCGSSQAGETYPPPFVVHNDDHGYALFHPSLVNDSRKQRPSFVMISDQGGFLLFYEAPWELGRESAILAAGMAYRDRVVAILHGTTAFRWVVTGLLIVIVSLVLHRHRRVT